MSTALSPPQIILVAAHLTATGDVAQLATLAARHGDVLRTRLMLRLLLTYLPTHLPTAEYLPLVQGLASGDFSGCVPRGDEMVIDTSSVRSLTDDQAVRKVRALRLQRLALPRDDDDDDDDDGDDDGDDDDALAAFLILRAHAVDDGAGALPELPALVAPFLDRSRRLRTWAISVLLPLLRRNCEYYADRPLPQTLADFERLPDRVAVAGLLAQTAQRGSDGDGDEGLRDVGRDLRGMIAPWLYSERRWTRGRTGETADKRAGATAEKTAEKAAEKAADTTPPSPTSPGWEEVLLWLTAQAATSATWRVAAQALLQWDGPGDADLGGCGALWLGDDELRYLEQRYARAAFACVYLVPDADDAAAAAAHAVVAKMAGLLGLDPIAPLPTDLALLPPVDDAAVAALLVPRHSIFLRHGLLDPDNALTTPSPAAAALLRALVLSAALLGRMGVPSTVRRAGELAVAQSAREQQAVAAQLVRWTTASGPRSDDRYWVKARNEILWLRDWGADDAAPADAHPADASSVARGVLGQVKRDYIEVEFLKALLANTRYSLARALYEDDAQPPLAADVVQDTVFAAALSAYDGASNPNRTRGGLKKCDDMIRAFPRTVDKSLPRARRVEALLAATHALGAYRLVLKQGEPFTPVVLRVHQDPLSVLDKVLEQNARSYANLPDLLRIAVHMADAGLAGPSASGAASPLPSSSSSPSSPPDPAQAARTRTLAERRVLAMCIEAALREDDFETAYSYVMSRLSVMATPASASDVRVAADVDAADVWSWRAALAAGKYRRTAQTLPPTHLGTASANLDIRHLEQRIECLATALRIAPSHTLQEILNAYRRCEEELEAAVRADDEQEHAWDDVADRAWGHAAPPTPRHKHLRSSAMPGAFAAAGYPRAPPVRGHIPMASRAAAAAAAAATATFGGQPAARAGPPSAAQPAAGDDAPLSLFDLSRATARAAQRNLSALSSLRQTRQLVGFGIGDGPGREDRDDRHGRDSRDGYDGRASHDSHDSRGSRSSWAARTDADADTDVPHVRKRDQLRDAAMGTLTSGVGWLIGAQPVDRRGHGSDRE